MQWDGRDGLLLLMLPWHVSGLLGWSWTCLQANQGAREDSVPGVRGSFPRAPAFHVTQTIIRKAELSDTLSCLRRSFEASRTSRCNRADSGDTYFCASIATICTSSQRKRAGKKGSSKRQAKHQDGRSRQGLLPPPRCYNELLPSVPNIWLLHLMLMSLIGTSTSTGSSRAEPYLRVYHDVVLQCCTFTLRPRH